MKKKHISHVKKRIFILKNYSPFKLLNTHFRSFRAHRHAECHHRHAAASGIRKVSQDNRQPHADCKRRQGQREPEAALCQAH